VLVVRFVAAAFGMVAERDKLRSEVAQEKSGVSLTYIFNF